MDDIGNETLWALGFHISATRYLKEGFPSFTNVTDLELITKPVVVDNPSQVVTESEKKVVKKKNKHVAKKKKQRAKLCAFIGSSLSLCSESSFLLLPCFMPVSLPTLVPAPISRLGSFIVLSSGCLPTLATSATLFLSCYALIFHYGIPTLLLPISMLSLPLPLSPLRILK